MIVIRAHFDGKSIVPDEPVDLSAGQRVVLHVELEDAAPTGTAQELLKSGLVGAWAHRDDIKDSLEYARELRRKAERRERG